jgi:hypothetical protein
MIAKGVCRANQRPGEQIEPHEKQEYERLVFLHDEQR